MQNEGFSKCKGLFKELVGKDLDEAITENTSIAVQKLFQLRNVIIHGNSFRVDYEQNESGVIQGKYKNLYTFFTDKELININDNEQNSAKFLFQNKVIDYLLEKFGIYIDELLKIYQIIPNTI